MTIRPWHTTGLQITSLDQTEGAMDYLMKNFELLLGPLLTLILTAIIVPYIGRLYRLHHEQGLMIRKKLLEHTGVVIFGLFDGGLQSDYLGGFLTVMFGETLFDLISGWNDAPSPNIIVPKTEYQSGHLQEILAAHASPFILQSGRINCYFAHTEQMGSWVYARRCRERGEKVTAMLSLETIGYFSDTPGSQGYPTGMGWVYPSVGNFLAFIGNTRYRRLVRQVVTAFRQTEPFPSEGGALPEIVSHIGRSDHWSFWQEGYPALMVADTAPFRYPHYHSTCLPPVA